MLEIEVLVCKSLGAKDCSTTGAIAIEEISPLNHEVLDLPKIRFHSTDQPSLARCVVGYTDDSMELAASVALRPSLSILVLACTVLTEVLRGLGGNICEELHLYPT